MNYDEWISYHLTVFGMSTDQDTLMVNSWAELFQAEGFTPEELLEATKFMATHEPPKFRQEHLRQIQERVRFSRERARPKHTRPEHPLGTCVICDGYGILGVPAAGAMTKEGNVIEEESVKTMSVYCRCALGNHMHRNQQYAGLETLNSYELRKPQWRDELKRIKQLMKSRVEVGQRATALDKVLGELVSKARSKQGVTSAENPQP